MCLKDERNTILSISCIDFYEALSQLIIIHFDINGGRHVTMNGIHLIVCRHIQTNNTEKRTKPRLKKM
jgi:hypothetical protein